ncbi:MAG TPA: PKD domain-containing protein [Acidimicrobiia bacterium]|nr:PKD domain-containing protein [Acidimicrobiia bacterium]
MLRSGKHARTRTGSIYRRPALAVLTAFMLLIAGVALADVVQNDVVAGGNDTISVGGSTTIEYRVTVQGGGLDGEGGCNATAASPATVTLNVPAGVTASTTTMTFTACQPAFRSVTFGSSTPGDYAITVASISDGGPGSYSNQANFTLHVNAATPTNTAPTVAFTTTHTTANEGDTKTFAFAITDTPADTHSFVTGFPDCGTGNTLVNASIDGSADTGTFQCLFPDGDVPAVTSTVGVQIEDQGGLPSNIATADVTVNNVAPAVSSLTGSTPVDEHSTATQTYTYAISEPGVDTVTATPECGTGNSVSEATNTNAGGSFKCTFPDGLDPAVESTVSVSATDSDGEEGNTTTFGVLVNNVAPTVVAGFDGAVDCRTNATVTIDPDDVGVNDSPWTIDIDWGDGTTEPEISRTDLEPFTVTHVYTLAGTYDATVSVTDKDGATGSDLTNSVTINQTYAVDFLPPFDESTPSGLIVNKMKNGRVVPVKVTLYDECGLAPVTDPDMDVSIKVTKTSGTGTGDPVEEYADAGQSSAGTNEFRWSDDGFWIYNLDSKYLGLVLNNLYRVDVYVGLVKGTVDNWAVVQPVK